jgi:hypothetical protein
MNHSTSGSPDGMHVLNYQGGHEFKIPSQIPEKLALAFIGMGVAEEINSTPKPRERKAISAAPENQAMNAAPENAKAKSTEEKPDQEKVIRVYQLAEELDIPSKDVIKAAKQVGIYARAPASGLSEDEVKRIKMALKK